MDIGKDQLKLGIGNMSPRQDGLKLGIESRRYMSPRQDGLECYPDQEIYESAVGWIRLGSNNKELTGF